jgi:ABC-type glycerol-3-phosphate transport system permease component
MQSIPSSITDKSVSNGSGAPISWLATVFKHVVLIIMTVLALFPLYFMTITAFKNKTEYTNNKFSLPTTWTWDNFGRVLSQDAFFKWFQNSIILTVGSVVISLTLAVLGAYAISKFQFPGKRLILNAMIVLMVLPPVVMVVPLFRMMSTLGMINSVTGVILIYGGLLLPFSIYLLTNFFRSIPNDILESAQIDGSSNFRIIYQFMVPLALPAFVTLIIVNSLWVWNEILISVIFLQDDSLKTLMTGLTVFKSKFTLDIPITMAGLIISTLPIVLLYLVAQKAFIEGLTAGATKG